MRRRPVPILLLGLGLGCGADAPTSTEGRAPHFGVAGSSGCYTVTVNSHASGQFPSFTGLTTGDVVATFTTLFDVGTAFAHGVVSGGDGLTTWNVTGGIIPELIGQQLVLSQSSQTAFAQDREPFLARVNGWAMPVSGASQARLTLHGTFDARDLTPPFEVDLVWNGVICP